MSDFFRNRKGQALMTLTVPVESLLSFLPVEIRSVCFWVKKSLIFLRVISFKGMLPK